MSDSVRRVCGAWCGGCVVSVPGVCHVGPRRVGVTDQEEDRRLRFSWLVCVAVKGCDVCVSLGCVEVCVCVCLWKGNDFLHHARC